MAKKTVLTKSEHPEILEKIRDATSDSTRQDRVHVVARLIEDYVKGDQWKEFNSRRTTIDRVPVPKDPRRQKDRPTVNLMFPLWKTLKSTLLQSNPMITATPENQDDVYDILSSDIGSRFVSYMDKTLMKRKRRKQMYNVLLSYGDVVLHPFISQTGHIDTRIIPPTQIFPYPANAQSWDQVMGVVWQRAVPVALIEQIYPDKKFSQNSIPERLHELRPGEDPGSDFSLICEFYLAPGSDRGKFPGLYVRTCEDDILEEEFLEEYPFIDPSLPFINVAENDMSDGIFGFPSTELVLSRQLDYNKAEGLMSEIRKCLPKLLVRYESKINPKEIIDSMTTVLEYMGEGGLPQWSSAQQPGAAVIDGVKSIPSQVEHTFGLHEMVLRAQSMGSVQSGVALAGLREQDLGRMYSLLENVKGGYEELYTVGYNMIRQYYSKPMIKSIMGDKGELYYKAYKSIPLSPMTFTLDADSLWPKSKAAEKDIAIRVAQYGGINMNDTRERIEFLKVVLPSLATRISRDSRDEMVARQENVDLLNGKKVVPDKFHNHMVHIDVLNDVIFNPAFRDLKDNIQSLFIAHRDVHQAEIDKKIAQMQAMAQAEAGPGKGTVAKPASEGIGQPAGAGLGVVG